MKYTLVLLFLVISACSQPEEEIKRNTYADLKGFFDAEASRLVKSDPLIKKTVARNDVSETRELKGIDWKTELSLFAESDINKPAWKDSYKVTNLPGRVSYKATDSSLRTREISINKDSKGKITKVTILNQSNNMLYSTTEQLMYIPDSLYQISKKQQVIVIGDNRYYINGEF